MFQFRQFLFRLLPVTLLTLASCAEKELPFELLVEKFPIEETLSGERIDLPLAEHLSNGFYTVGDFYVDQAIRAPFFFITYDREFNLCDTIIRNGQGPDELTSASFFGQWSGEPSNPDLLLFDDNSNRIFGAHINPFDHLTPLAALSVSEYLSPSRLYRLPGDSVFVGINLEMTRASEIIKYNTLTNTLTTYPQPFSFDSKYAFYTSQCSFCVNGAADRFCSFFLSMPWFVIYDKSFEPIRKVALYDAVNSESLTMNSPAKGFISPAFIGDKIVALYKNEAEEGADTQLTVFDSMGNPLAMYLVGDAIGYTIDIDRRNILTIHYDQEADVIYLMKRPIPDILK